jgi:hypothetical protein
MGWHANYIVEFEEDIGWDEREMKAAMEALTRKPGCKHE